MKIYTKTGDKGTTRLVDGSCVEKFNPRVEAYGTVDELNSYLGVIASLVQPITKYDLKKTSFNTLIAKTQNNLFIVGSLLATSTPDMLKKLPQLTESDVSELESTIDEMTAELPELKNFILPTGYILSSHLQFARTLCRRSERRAAELANKDLDYELVLIYLNRLSDFLFTAARFVNARENFPDILWQKR